MKKVVRSLVSIFILLVFSIPQIAKSYDFDNKQREERAIQTRSEIYDLYNLRKEIINESSSSDDNQFGVVGYNGVCSTVTVNGGTVSLDDYIAGVIKQEMGGDTLEALKAQAIAARSFLLSTHKNSTDCSVVNGQSYQAYTQDTDSNSVYKQAVSATSGMVVSRNDEVALTQYQSYPAGRWQTEDSSGWHVQFQRFADDESTRWTWNGPSKATVKAISYGTEMNYDNPHNWGMSQTIAVYLAKADNYTYDKLIDLFYNEPIVTLSDGVYDDNISYVNSEFGKVAYFNQGDYSAYYYSSNVNSYQYCGTIAECGCGPTSVAIVASSILGKTISPIETTQKLCSMGGCTDGGSYAYKLTEELNTVYKLNAKGTNSDQEAIDALGTGKALIIVNMGPGLFTSSGHFMVLAGVNSQKQVLVVEPGSRAKNNQWFDFNIIMEQRRKHADSYIIVTK